MILDESVERFLKEKTRRVGGCWIWTGGTNQDGVPVVYYRGKTVSFKRLLYKAVTGEEIPPHYNLSCNCNTTRCVNMDHHSLRDHREVQIKRHRDKRFSGHLSFEKVERIREMLREGYSCTNIAEEMEVSTPSIYRIKNSRTWRE